MPVVVVRLVVVAVISRVARVRFVVTTTVLRVILLQSLVALILVVSNMADSAVIASTAITHESMAAPTMAIAISRPWTHAYENPVVEITRAVIASWRASIWRRCVVSV